MGNVGSGRYDVFPSGSYTIGDEWHSVVSQTDSGSNVTNAEICGSTTENTTTSTCGPHGTLGGWNYTGSLCAQVAAGHPCFGVVGGLHPGCFDFLGSSVGCGCTNNFQRSVPNTCYVPNWSTTYRRHKYEFLQWTVIGDYSVAGQFTS